MNLRLKRAKPYGLVRLQALPIIYDISGRFEMSTSREHLIKDGSNAVNVSSLIDVLAGFGLLRRHVLKRTDNVAGQRQGMRTLTAFGLAKQIGHERFAIFTEQDISGLEIPVKDSRVHERTGTHRIPSGSGSAFARSEGPRLFGPGRGYAPSGTCLERIVRSAPTG